MNRRGRGLPMEAKAHCLIESCRHMYDNGGEFYVLQETTNEKMDSPYGRNLYDNHYRLQHHVWCV